MGHVNALFVLTRVVAEFFGPCYEIEREYAEEFHAHTRCRVTAAQTAGKADGEADLSKGVLAVGHYPNRVKDGEKYSFTQGLSYNGKRQFPRG